VSDPLLQDLIPFDGDPEAILLWDNFTNPVTNALRRMFMRVAEDDSWIDGIQYRHLEGLRMTDIMDTPSVGSGRAEKMIQELTQAFAIYEAEGPSGAIETYIEVEEEPYIDRIDEATNFHELIEAIYAAFDEYRPVDDRTRSILESRVDVFKINSRSLEEIGQQWGVTRERIRQIESKYKDLELGVAKNENAVVESIIGLLEISNSEEEFIENAKGSEVVEEESISVERLRAVIKVLGMYDALSRLEAVEESWQASEDAQGEIVKAVRGYRSKLGLLDLGLFKKDFGITEDEAIEAILEVYPRSVSFGNLVLARTDALMTNFENALGKQLLVYETLSAEKLLDGIERSAAFRKYPFIGSVQDQVGIVHEIAGKKPNLKTFQKNCGEPPELNETDLFFLENFRNAPAGMLHRNEITAAALNDQKNVGTINLYLLYNPLIRFVGAAVLALADQDIDPEISKQYAKIARAAEEKTLLTYEFAGTNIQLKFFPNLNTMAAGVLFPPPDLRALISELKFTVVCDCGKLQTEQQLRFKLPTFWTGFTSAIKHLTDHHHYSKGEEITILIDFDSTTARVVLS